MHKTKRLRLTQSGTNRQGFTLIELLVVISIIGLLSSILVVNLKRARDKARLTAYVFNLEKLADAIELYELDNGAYPNAIYGGYLPASDPNSWESFVNLFAPYSTPQSLLQTKSYPGLQMVFYTPYMWSANSNCARPYPYGTGFTLIAFFGSPNEFSLNDGGIYDYTYEVFRGNHTQGTYWQNPQTGEQTCG